MLVVLWLLLTVIAALLLRIILWRWLLLLRRRRRWGRRRAPLAPLAARCCRRCEQRCNGASSSFHAAAVARCALQQEGACCNWTGGCTCLAKAQATGPSASRAFKLCTALTTSRRSASKKPPRVLVPLASSKTLASGLKLPRDRRIRLFTSPQKHNRESKDSSVLGVDAALPAIRVKNGSPGPYEHFALTLSQTS